MYRGRLARTFVEHVFIQARMAACNRPCSKGAPLIESPFDVDGVAGDGLTYDATANHDPDGDSDGTSITVIK